MRMHAPLSSAASLCEFPRVPGNLADKKTPPPRTLQQAYAQGPVVVLGGGRFLISEVPLYVRPFSLFGGNEHRGQRMHWSLFSAGVPRP